MTKWVCLIIGSITGGSARYLLTSFTHERLGFHFPFGTLAVNASGCLIIGILNSLADAKAWVGPNERLLLMTGFCGAYTTFSSWMMETSSLAHEGDVGLAWLNIGLSLALGFALFRIGMRLGKAF